MKRFYSVVVRSFGGGVNLQRTPVTRYKRAESVGEAIHQTMEEVGPDYAVVSVREDKARRSLHYTRTNEIFN